MTKDDDVEHGQDASATVETLIYDAVLAYSAGSLSSSDTNLEKALTTSFSSAALKKARDVLWATCDDTIIGPKSKSKKKSEHAFEIIDAIRELKSEKKLPKIFVSYEDIWMIPRRPEEINHADMSNRVDELEAAMSKVNSLLSQLSERNNDRASDVQQTPPDTSYKTVDKDEDAEPSTDPSNGQSSKDVQKPNHRNLQQKPQQQTDDTKTTRTTYAAKTAIIGTSTDKPGLKGSARPHPIYVGRLKPDTKPTDVKEYIYKHIGIRVPCEQIRTRNESYASFKIYVDKGHLERVFDPKCWPAEVMVNYFKTRSTQKRHDTRRDDNLGPRANWDYNSDRPYNSRDESDGYYSRQYLQQDYTDRDYIGYSSGRDYRYPRHLDDEEDK